MKCILVIEPCFNKYDVFLLTLINILNGEEDLTDKPNPRWRKRDFKPTDDDDDIHDDDDVQTFPIHLP